MTLRIRPATLADTATIVGFNARLAAETEDKALDQETLTAGVGRVLADERLGRYFVAELDGEVVGQMMVTYEWSDWRNGTIWWIQSVYVDKGARRSGVFSRLYASLEKAAREAADVVGIRLYVENENGRAQATYRALDFVEPGYRVMERML